MTNKTDPIYGHNIGNYPCKIKDCQGHVLKYQPSLHVLCESKPKKNITEKEEKPIIDKIQHKLGRPPKEKQDIESHPQNKNPAHYHKGRRGKCKCDKPNG